MHTFAYLALGDSYTIGEGVALHLNFPYQTVALLREAGYAFHAPEIVAKTGWTTGELESAMGRYPFLPKYDLVSLLIGVNNQYRGGDIVEYKEQFERLLKRAIGLAGGRPEHVVVISIPDYGTTPFGQKMDVHKIAREIDGYNSLNKALSIQYKVQYVDVTPVSRDTKAGASAIAADGLHPSEEQYARWAKEVFAVAKKAAKK